MSGFGYNVLGFGANASSAAAGGASDDQFNRVSFLSHFDGANNGVNNSFDDGSANNYTVTAAGDVTQGSFGPFARPDGEWGVDFDGTNDGLRLQSSDFGISTEAFTAECWVFPTKVPDNSDSFMWCMDATQSNASGNTWALRANNGKVQIFTVSSGSLTAKESTASLNINAWNHVAISRSGTTMYVALNGTVESATCASSLNNQQYLHIGCAASNVYAYFFQGVISNARYLVGTALYTSDYTVPTGKLTAITNTDLLTCQSNRFVDNSASGHAITITGEPAVTAFGPFLTSSVYDPAVNGASAYMDGSGDTLRATWTAADIINQNFTLEYWLYFQETSGYGTVSIGANDNSASYVHLSYASNGQVFSDDGQNSGSGPATSAGAISPNSWNHLALVRVSNDMFIYINGAKIATKAITASLFQGQSGEFGIGYIANPLEGYICDARVVTSAVYTGDTYTVPTAPLTAITNTKLLLNMKDGQAIDSAAQNNLTLYDGANISTTQKKFGDSSVYLDGDDLVRTAVNPSFAFGTGDFTIEGWVYLTAINQYDNIFDMRHSGSTTHIDVYFDGSPLRLRYFVNGGERFTSDTAVSLNTWTHLALVRSSGTTKLYQQGTSVGSYSDSTNLSSGQLHLGGRYSSENFAEGYFDEVRVSNMARYTSNFTAPSAAFADKGQ
jgi:hypothetical protein